MTRVLHLLSGPGGGSTLSTIELARALAERGFEPHAVCQSLHGTAGERADLVEAFDGRVSFVPLYTWYRRIRTEPVKRVLVVGRQEVVTAHGLRSARTVRSLIQDRGIDLVHTATFVLPDGVVAARSLGLPHVMHVRELVGPGQPFRIAGEGPRLARALGGERECLVANSATTAALLAPTVPGLDAAVVPNGLDLARFDDVAAERDPDAPVRVVAMVGNLSALWKRHELFIDAAAVVAEHHPEIEFRIYGHRPEGTGGYADELLRRARDLGLGDRLVLTGFVADPTAVMRECDVIVQPTSAESFGRVAVEAMAAKVAVVGVAEGPLGELIEHERSGLLVPSDAPTDLAAAIERVVDDHDLRAKLVAGGRERAWDLFSVDRCAERMAAIYDAQLRLGRGAGEPLARSWASVITGRFFG